MQIENLYNSYGIHMKISNPYGQSVLNIRIVNLYTIYAFQSFKRTTQTHDQNKNKEEEELLDHHLFNE